MHRAKLIIQLGFVVVLLMAVAAQGCARKKGAVQAGAAIDANGTAADRAAPSTDELSFGDREATEGPTSQGPTAGLSDVFFDFDSALLQPDAQRALDSVVEWLRESRTRRLMLEGHADERGTNEYNLALAERRALAAKRYVVASGIDGQRIETISYGEERVFCRERLEPCYRQNRRAHLVEAH
jgi:peptidoglycan-associated lipoprotein